MCKCFQDYISQKVHWITIRLYQKKIKNKNFCRKYISRQDRICLLIFRAVKIIIKHRLYIKINIRLIQLETEISLQINHKINF